MDSGPADGPVVSTIRRRKYDLIIYDEAHYLVDSKTPSVRDDGASWFNGLLNEAQVPLLLVGYDQLGTVIRRKASWADASARFHRFDRMSIRLTTT